MSGADKARAEAKRRYPEDYASENDRLGRRSEFVKGAKWEASRPITDEQVEAAARAIHDIDKDKAQSDYGVTLKDWERLDEPALGEFREYARAALEAARGVQP